MSCLDKMLLSRAPQDTHEKGLLNHCLTHRTSFLCALILEQDHPLQVCRSAAGFYLGVFDPQQGPLSRDSQEYWKEQAMAQQALVNRAWTQRLDP